MEWNGEKVLVQVIKCRKCGVDHGMGILDTVTEVHTPIDLCYDCLWNNNMCYTPAEPIVMPDILEEPDAWKEWSKELQRAQDQIIRDMMISSAVPLVEGKDPPRNFGVL